MIGLIITAVVCVVLLVLSILDGIYDWWISIWLMIGGFISGFVLLILVLSIAIGFADVKKDMRDYKTYNIERVMDEDTYLHTNGIYQFIIKKKLIERDLEEIK